MEVIKNNTKLDLLELKDKNPFIIALGLVALNVVSLLFLLFFSIALNTNSGFLTMTIPTIISFIILPKLYLKFFKIKDKLNIKKYLKLTVTVFTLFLVIYFLVFKHKIDVDMIIFWIINYIFVAIGEEYVYRHLLINLLSKKLNLILSIIISSFVFTFILHNNEPFISNLIIRFPLAIILSGLYVKTKSLSIPVLVHAMYNLVVLMI